MSDNISKTDLSEKNNMQDYPNQISLSAPMEEVSIDPNRKIEQPRKRRKIEFWTDEEVKRMLSLTKGRNYIAIGMGYFLGLRVNELRLVKVSDVDFRNMRVWVHGKGGIRTFVPMLKDGTIFWTDLRTWIEGEPLDNYVLRGRKSDGTISTKQLNRIVKKYADMLNLTYMKRAHFHMLRHSRASFLYSKTGNLSLVQEFLRHAFINTTEIYKHTTTENLKREIDRHLRGL